LWRALESLAARHNLLIGKRLTPEARCGGGASG
jgi:hypothetical protein